MKNWVYRWPMTSNNPNKVLYKTLLALLRPLVRMLLHRGVSAPEFTEIVRRAYVSVADAEFSLDKRKQTASRIAVLTGLNRVEVARLREIDDDTDNGPHMFHNRAARVVSGWTGDERFSPEGVARDLPLDGEHGFAALVTSYSGGMPMRAVLDELKRVGTVRETDEGLLHLCADAYIPVSGDNQKLQLMGVAASDLLNTLHHNINLKEQRSRFQLSVDNEDMSAEAIERFRTFCDEKSLDLLKEFNTWLHANATNPNVHNSSTTDREQVRRIGVGIYYFEDEAPPDEH